MKQVRVGVVGIGRGSMVWDFCSKVDDVKLVAVCDKWEGGLEKLKADLDDPDVSYYKNYDEFLKHDMDCVVLANYATEHAPFAVKAMKAGKNVISEVLPAQTMAQAVELVECCEQTGKIYCYAENYCFMGGPREMKKFYKEGKLGELEYGEGEYMHNCEPIWTDITYGNREHWRNRMSAFYYCTHSVGPLIHITGIRPKSVTGFEGLYNPRMQRMGARAGSFAVEMVTLENGTIFKSAHGVGPSKCSVWYSVYGANGRMETAREDTRNGDFNRIYVNLDSKDGAEDAELKNYIPVDPDAEKAKDAGHGGSDFFCLLNAFRKIAGDDSADTIDVYEALDMWMVGFFGYLSVLEGGIPQAIPDLHDPKVRDQYRNDFRCTEPELAGDQLQPSYSKGTPEVEDSLYEAQKKDWMSRNPGER